MLAAITEIKRLEIAEADARSLAGALIEVQRHYPLPSVKPGHMALATLAWTAGRIYLPMVRDIVTAGPGAVPGAAQDAPAAQAPAPVIEGVPVTSETSQWFGAPSPGDRVN